MHRRGGVIAAWLIRWDEQARYGKKVGKWLRFIICTRFGQCDWTDLRNESGSAK
jgi:hypothetical protein